MGPPRRARHPCHYIRPTLTSGEGGPEIFDFLLRFSLSSGQKKIRLCHMMPYVFGPSVPALYPPGHGSVCAQRSVSDPQSYFRQAVTPPRRLDKAEWGPDSDVRGFSPGPSPNTTSLAPLALQRDQLKLRGALQANRDIPTLGARRTRGGRPMLPQPPEESSQDRMRGRRGF